MSLYPTGVRGNEYAVNGPDWEKEHDGFCPRCGREDTVMEQGYRGDRWLSCGACFWTKEMED